MAIFSVRPSWLSLWFGFSHLLVFMLSSTIRRLARTLRSCRGLHLFQRGSLQLLLMCSCAYPLDFSRSNNPISTKGDCILVDWIAEIERAWIRFCFNRSAVVWIINGVSSKNIFSFAWVEKSLLFGTLCLGKLIGLGGCVLLGRWRIVQPEVAGWFSSEPWFHSETLSIALPGRPTRFIPPRLRFLVGCHLSFVLNLTVAPHSNV